MVVGGCGESTEVAGGHPLGRVVGVVVEWSKRPNPFQRLRAVWRYRELLRNLVRKEIKIKYKNSILGVVWTLLNPTLYLVVFTIVFEKLLDSQVPYSERLGVHW